MRSYLFSISALLALGCSNPDTEPQLSRDSVSQRARDSAIGASGLPGATGINASLRLSDSADARRQREDSVANTP